jgi:hypothetical protein
MPFFDTPPKKDQERFMVENKRAWFPLPFGTAIEQENPDVLICYLVDLAYMGTFTIKVYDLPIPFYCLLRIPLNVDRILVKLLC